MNNLLNVVQCRDVDMDARALAGVDDDADAADHADDAAVAPAAAARKSSPPNAVVKALTLLDALGTGRAGEALSTLAARTSLPKSTVCRLLKTMEAQGFVARRGQLYCLGSRVSELGRRAGLAEHTDLRNLSLGVLERLVDEVRATVHLAVLTGPEVLVLEKITAAGCGRIPTRVGLTVPAGCTALGKAQLAYASQQTIEAAMRALQPAPTHSTARSMPELLAKLAEVRQNGVAVDREEFRTGITCVAAPVVSQGRVIAAISVSSHGVAANWAVRTKLVRSSAARLSQLLGRNEHLARGA